MSTISGSAGKSGQTGSHWCRKKKLIAARRLRSTPILSPASRTIGADSMIPPGVGSMPISSGIVARATRRLRKSPCMRRHQPGREADLPHRLAHHVDQQQQRRQRHEQIRRRLGQGFVFPLGGQLAPHRAGRHPQQHRQQKSPRSSSPARCGPPTAAERPARPAPRKSSPVHTWMQCHLQRKCAERIFLSD